MLAEHIEEALGVPLGRAALEEVTRRMWRAFGEGLLTEAQAERLDGLIRERQARLRALEGQGTAQRGPQGVFAAAAAAVRRARRRPRSPDRQASLERRRGVAFSGGMPSSLARLFTPGQVAVLSVVGREAARGRPSCEMPLGKIGALAGVGRTTVQEALRAARGLGLVWVRERRRRGERSETNVVTILSKGWWRWLKRHLAPEAPEETPRKGTKRRDSRRGGFGKANPTDTKELRREKEAAKGARRTPDEGWGELEDRRGPRTERRTPPEGPARGG